jgi:hypothetical protein
MQTMEIIIVGLIIAGALVYLYRTFKPKPRKTGGCGCGNLNCKVPKPKIHLTKD